LKLHSLVSSLLLATSILGSSACKKSEADTGAALAAEATAGATGLTVKPDRVGGLAVKGAFGVGDYLLEEGTRVTLAITGKPGTHVTVQSTSFDLGADPVRVSVDLWAAYAAMPAASPTVDVKVIASEGGKPAHFEVVSFATKSEWSGFTDLSNGKRALPTDAQATHKDDVLLAWRLDHVASPVTLTHEMKVFGTANARTLDVDKVAVVSEVVDKELPCGTFRNKAGKTIQVSRRAMTTKIKVADRHKKTTEEKSFTGTMPECPAKVQDAYGAGSTIDGRAEAATIDGYLSGLVKPGALESMAVPPGDSRLATGGGAPAATADAPGFPSIATLKARVGKVGYKIAKADGPSTDDPHEMTISLANGTAGCSTSPDVRLWDFDAYNVAEPHAFHVDDKRAVWIQGSKGLVDKVTPALASVSGEPKAFPGFLKSKGLPPSSAPMDSEYTSARGLSMVLTPGNDVLSAHLVSIVGLAKVKGIALRRSGNRVLLVECMFDETGVAPKMVDALAK
jgi:hypothetical protein